MDAKREPEQTAAAAEFLRTDFMHALAHAIRSPLSVVHGVMREVGAGHPVPPRLVELAQRNVDRITSLAKQLDAVADLEQGRVTPRPARYDLVAIADEAVAQHRTDEKLVWECDAPTGKCPVQTDRDLVLRVCHAALDNAHRFAKSRVRVTVTAAEDTVRLTIEDDGPGIDAERLPSLLARFSNARERGADTDLAWSLSMARDYALLLGGNLLLGPSSDLGGLCCTLQLPLDNP